MVNEQNIRTRAYFHYANRTGSDWQDPVSNWTQAFAEEMAADISGELFTFRLNSSSN